MKKWVSVLFLCLLLGIVSGISVYQTSIWWQKQKTPTTPAPPDTSALQTPPLAPPIANAADSWVKDGLMPQRDRLVVPEGSEIKAIFGGTVTYVGLVERDGQPEATNIILHNPQTKQGASYLLPDNAQVLVTQDQIVTQDQVLARLTPGGQNMDCLAGANVAITYLLDGEIVPVAERWYQ